MPEYDNTNSGALFRNDKQGNEKRPDYKGSLNVGGVEYWISGWMRESKKGARFMSLAVQPKEKRERRDDMPPTPPPPDEPYSDDIPF